MSQEKAEPVSPPPLEGVEGIEGFEFVIEADGSVTFIDFPPEMLDIALALNPDDPLVCERRALLAAGDEGREGG